MTTLGVDANVRLSGATLKAKGVTAAGRYVGTDSRCITKAEYDDLVAHGIKVWLVREWQTADLGTSMLLGHDFGVSEAKKAQAALDALGVPNAPVFWAADYDIGPGSSRLAGTDAYVAGWNTIIPAGRRGGYGGLWYLKHVGSAIDFRWECASTSFRHGLTLTTQPVHIRQTTLAPPVAGTDHNYIYQATFGQTTAQEDDVVTQAEITAIAKASAKETVAEMTAAAVLEKQTLHILQHVINNGSKPTGATLANTISRINQEQNSIATYVAEARDDIKAALSAAVTTITSGIVTDLNTALKGANINVQVNAEDIVNQALTRFGQALSEAVTP